MATTSETRRTPEAGREPEATVRRIGEAAGASANDARELGEKGLDAVARTTGAAAGAARRLAEQGRDVMGTGLRAAAEANIPLADASYGEGRRLLEDTTRAVEAYRKATDDTAEDVRALIAASTQLGHGLQRMQHAYLDGLRRALARARRQPHDLLRCRSAAELAEVQRDLYMDGVATSLEVGTTLLRLAGEVVRDAARPLEARAGAHPRT